MDASIEQQLEQAAAARDAASARIAHLERERQIAEAVEAARNEAENKLAIAEAKAEHPSPAPVEPETVARDKAVERFIDAAVASGASNAYLTQNERALMERFTPEERMTIFRGIDAAAARSSYARGCLIRPPEGVEQRQPATRTGFSFSRD